jgi:hypothetical protein
MSNEQEPNDTLPPSSEEQVGLLTVPKERHVFKAPAPKTSLLGLDRLAAQKRAEQAKQCSILGTFFHLNLTYLVCYKLIYTIN